MDAEISVFVYFNQALELSHIHKKTRFFPFIEDQKTYHDGEESINSYVKWLNGIRFTGKEEFLSTDFRFKEGTKLIFSTTEKGGITAEVISPGPWARATCFTLGHTDDPNVSEGLMRTILGREPLDEKCKREVGKNALYLAGGGSYPRSRFEASLPFRTMNDWKRPGTPPYPYPVKLHTELANDALCLFRKPPSYEERHISMEALSDIKRDNRRRVENSLNIKLLNIDESKHTCPLEHIEFEVKLRKLPGGKIPCSIKRYPVEFADLQSPYKFFNEPSNIAIVNGFQGYEARLTETTHDNVYRPFKIPSLEPNEDSLASFDIPTCIIANQKKHRIEKVALLYRFLEEKKNDLSYKGIFYNGDLEKLDIWSPPLNKNDSLFESFVQERIILIEWWTPYI
jgi:hypothetical protein